MDGGNAQPWMFLDPLFGCPLPDRDCRKMANRWLKERKATLSVPSPIFLWERGGRGCLSFFSALFNFCKLRFSGQFKQHQRFGGQGQTVCVGWMQKPPAPSPVARFAGAKSCADLSQPEVGSLNRSGGWRAALPVCPKRDWFAARTSGRELR